MKRVFFYRESPTRAKACFRMMMIRVVVDRLDLHLQRDRANNRTINNARIHRKVVDCRYCELLFSSFSFSSDILADPPTRAAPPPQAPSISMDRDQSDESVIFSESSSSTFFYVRRPLARPGTASAAKGRKPMKPTPSDELSSSAGR